jgi:hypothetical protein
MIYRVCHGSGTGLEVPHRTCTRGHRTRETTGTVLHMYIYGVTHRRSVGGLMLGQTVLCTNVYMYCTGVLHLCIIFIVQYFSCITFLMLHLLYSTLSIAPRWHEVVLYHNVRGSEVC